MNTNKTKGRIEKMTDSFLNTATESLTKWGNEYIAKTIPLILDDTTSSLKNIFNNFLTPNQTKISSSLKKAVNAGISIGEKNKEQAIMHALANSGFSNSQIAEIMNKSNEYLVTYDKIDN